MNPNSAETRRQMRPASQDDTPTTSRFGRALRSAFDSDSRSDSLDRESFTASRRGFLRIGGLTVAASAVLVACGTESDSAGVARTGSLPEPGEPEDPTAQPGPEMDNTLLLTSSSVEALAIATYDQILEAGWLEQPQTNEMAEMFRQHHSEHLEELVATTEGLGLTAFTDPNPYLWETVIEPELTTLEGLEGSEQRQAVLDLAYLVEDMASQNYVRSAGLLTTPEMREGAMAIGGVEARHVSVVLATLGEPAVPFAFGRTTQAPATDDELITG